MSYYNPETYNRNNLLRYCEPEAINAVWGADYLVETILHLADELSDNACKEVQDALEAIRTYAICTADEIMVSLIDNIPEGIEVDEVPEGEIIYSLVDSISVI